MEIFGIGLSELFIIVAIALIYFKPHEIPGLIKGIVKHIQKFRVMSSRVKYEISELYRNEIEPHVDKVKAELNEESIPFRSKLSEEFKIANEEMASVRSKIKLENPFPDEASKQGKDENLKEPLEEKQKDIAKPTEI